ncbi:alpha/beta hydrolase [Nocardia sp. NBC_00508]|uniref:alpha/beta hydrolase n=1 Tax=Nocardia sp. NBC_00508 TaxID=2975992 RepID=UPI002E815206|nr:alpha/beta hydrolase [Nocardia sp. NBC_00508]WUD66161.1 alpha/beta hydrolase [Nocardia sp. NBC_00508]
MRGKVPLGVRILTALTTEPDWDSITPAQVIEVREAQHRKRRSALGRFVTGKRDRGAQITTSVLDLPGRRLSARVYRPERGGSELPLIVAFHGGGLILGAPDQDDWLLSHLAANCPAVVVSVDYRLAPEHPVPAPVEDAYDSVSHLVDEAARWGADPTRLALLGASAGATLATLTAIRAVGLGLPVRAQVLINPQLDWTDRAFEYPSFTENADSPTATPANCRAVQRIVLPESFDPRVMSPVHSDNLAGLPPALVQAVGTDPLEDQAPAYAARLREAGVEVTLTRYPEAVHAFLSMPGLVPAARPARAEILAHLRSHLLERSGSAATRATKAGRR